ncbi:MAG: hypothetical protein KDH17_20625 [Rhodocyclaceae bacterium]|nr:hypothetical protein [Rhodocyclaceae bacterium]
MGYDRIYAREEIHQMLCLSERRLRPTAPVAKAHAGHAISQHTEQRDDPFDRRHIRQDSTFASRKDLVLAVEEALHATAGQAELATLNSHGVDSCRIVFQLNATQGRIRADVVLNPMAKVGKKQVPAQGPAQYLRNVPVNSVVLIIDKLAPPESWAPLHFQTAYPKDVDH